MLHSKYLDLTLLFIIWFSLVNAQSEGKKQSEQLEFTHDLFLDHTSVKSQDKTGTCWSYSSISFIEAELLRMGKGEHDLSEMYYVYHNYQRKAHNFLLRQGKTQFSQGSLNHDVLAVVDHYGVIPQSIYSGDNTKSDFYNHAEMEALLKAFLTTLVTKPGGNLSEVWIDAYRGILNAYMGKPVDYFDYKGAKYTPREFAEALNLSSNQYASLTSFSHHPFETTFILEIPDNWSNGSFYNMPLDDLMQVLNQALERGFTVAWDADVSEQTWSRKEDIAKWPAADWKSLNKEERDVFFKSNVVKEAVVSQEMRQEAFENLSTTDDHLMHIVGTAKDQYGNLFYVVKNSWGKNRPHDGLVYVSEAYMRMKTISFSLHKDALDKKLRKEQE